MSDDTNEPQSHPAHFIVTQAIMPKPTDSLEEWAQRSTMLADMAEQLASHLYQWMLVNVPMLASYDQLPAHLIAGVGVLCRGIRDTGRVQLEKRGTAPLSIEEDQANYARDRLADPSTSPEEREFLLAVLAHKLECEQGDSRREAPEEASEEWPDVLVSDENEAG